MARMTFSARNAEEPLGLRLFLCVSKSLIRPRALYLKRASLFRENRFTDEFQRGRNQALPSPKALFAWAGYGAGGAVSLKFPFSL